MNTEAPRKRTFHKFIAPVERLIAKAAQRFDSDKGYRKFFTRLHVLSQVYFQLSDLRSLRELGEALREDERLREVMETSGVDNSNISRANERRTFAIFRYIFHGLFPKARSCAEPALGLLSTLHKVKILDGSFIRCCASMAWARYKKTKNGLKIHLLLDLRLIPDKLVVTAGACDERDILRQVIKRGVTYIFDRGYNCYALFAQLSRSGVFFVTRLLSNAVYEIVGQLPLDEEAIKQGILGDFRILLGGPTTRVTVLFRLIIYRAPNGKLFSFLTNRWDLHPWVICEMYRCRWQIELFFRWIKQNLKVKRFIGRSENAVLIQLYAALITFLLLQIFASKVEGAQRVTRWLLRRVRRTLFYSIPATEITTYLAAIDTS
jgi:hypothetical protein